MGKKIISSKNEYETNYNKSLENFKSTFDEVDEIDFVKDEIQDYKLYSIIVASRTNVVFNPMFNVFDGLASKEEGYTEDIIKNLKENKSVYYSIREVLGLDPIYWTLFTKIEDIDIKVRQLRLGFSKILTFLETKKSELEASQQIETVKTKKPKKTLLEFIHNVEDKKGFILDLKNTFTTEQGKSIKAIVLKLIDDELLIFGTKEFKQFCNELEIYFKRDIGTYQSINDPKTVDAETTNIILKKLNPLITKYKTI